MEDQTLKRKREDESDDSSDTASVTPRSSQIKILREALRIDDEEYLESVFAFQRSHRSWQFRLLEVLKSSHGLPITDPMLEIANATFEQALVTMYKVPQVWTIYLRFLMEQRLITRTCETFDRALQALPAAEHRRLYELYVDFVNKHDEVPIETSSRVHRVYLKLNPSHVEAFIEFLLKTEQWNEAAERLVGVLSADQFQSVKNKTMYELWTELHVLFVSNPGEDWSLDVLSFIRKKVRGDSRALIMLRKSLSQAYARKNLPEKARDVLDEGLEAVVSSQDFSLLFKTYLQFEDSKYASISNYDDYSIVSKDMLLNYDMPTEQFQKKYIKGVPSHKPNRKEVQKVTNRMVELVSEKLLRQSPHNVTQWHRRVKIFKGNLRKQVEIYRAAASTVDPMKAMGKPHTLWVALAKLLERNGKIADARDTFERAVKARYREVDDLAIVWCEWIEFELRQGNHSEAARLITQAIAMPPPEIEDQLKSTELEPMQLNLHKSLKIWSLYLHLGGCFGCLETTRESYEQMLESGMATPQIVINYASYLQRHNLVDESFRVFERSVRMFNYPDVKNIWLTYLSQFVETSGKSQLKRARELFEQAIENTPPEFVKPLYIKYAKLEEEHGLTQQAMEVYKRAVKAVPVTEKLSMYRIFIAHVLETYGTTKAREIYEQAIESGLTEEDTETMSLRFAEFETSLGEINRARAIYHSLSLFADPRFNFVFWNKWCEFELHHGNKETYQELLRIKRIRLMHINSTYPT